MRRHHGRVACAVRVVTADANAEAFVAVVLVINVIMFMNNAAAADDA